jgi:hypothetical protein
MVPSQDDHDMATHFDGTGYMFVRYKGDTRMTELNRIEKRLMKVKHPVLVGMFEEASERLMDALKFTPEQKERYWKYLFEELGKKK